VFETIGVPELLIIFAIVMLLFGAGKVSRLGKDLGTSVKEFRRAMTDAADDGNPATAIDITRPAELPAAATPAVAASADGQPPVTAQIF
jgi:sec-independent protein translocase protein TatA